MIVIVDYGMGNLGSILNMLKKLGFTAKISSEKNDILAAEKLILPGVGAFDQGMLNLAERGLIEILSRRVVEDRCPVLGICLGMQLMSLHSEEGRRPGLGWIEASTQRFRFDNGAIRLKIPHMGWNVVHPVEQTGIFTGFEQPPRFYFVHSYHVCCASRSDILATSIYGYEFSAAIRRDNIWGTQFHPEKSHKFGMHLLHNYASMG